MKIETGNPPPNAKRVFGWHDTPALENPTWYRVEDECGKSRSFIAKGKRRRVLEGLMRSPLLSASYARLSDHVDHLRRSGVDIETKIYLNDPETGREKYGVYFLNSRVTRIEADEVAA